MKKLYIDIDGVLLTAKNTQRPQYAVEFIDYITSAFDCYWFTTHCKGEESIESLLLYLSPYYDAKTIEKLRTIKPTSWMDSKIEAIDIHSDFYWLDDYVFNFEKRILEGFDAIDRLIEVNLNYKNELKHIKEFLESKQSEERKYLFLDLEGVLNTGKYSTYLEKNNLPQFDKDGAIFDPKAVENLQYIIDKTHAEIILTSTWRYDGFDKMYQLWKNRDLPSVLVSMTPDLFRHGEKRAIGFRGLEIDSWLNYGRSSDFYIYYSYAIVDDEDDFLSHQLEHVVLTDPMKGITKEVADKVISILQSKSFAFR